MISIIVPAHNEENNLIALLKTMETVAGIGDAEIIIALSPESIAADTAKVNLEVQWLRCRKKGRAAQMNEGSMLAKGNTLVFLHADVKPPATFLKDIKSTLTSNFDAGFFSYIFDKDNFWLNINASFTGHDGIFTGGGDQCLFIRTSIFEQLNRFNEAQLLMEDFDFFKRMKRAKVPYTIIKSNLVVSARKYERNSYLRVNISNLLLVLLFNFGYPTSKLKSIHDKLIRR
ncbi:glycosyltransferase [Maribacter chungangensis]|uniref:Glycosyltransferase n=1 Tax=Maribacter chungangensis TaxID=1069117 RepID=A0ABW3B4E0_9FLAO